MLLYLMRLGVIILSEGIRINGFDEFNVHQIEDKCSFIHVNISEETFYEDLFNYFFDDQRILRYAENNKSIKFAPSRLHYTTLYKNLLYYIDQENIFMSVEDLSEEIVDILLNEYEHERNAIGNIKVRLDKIGKIGEYVFSSLLWDYFEFDCIIPKLSLTTDYNMSIYGIDALYYSSSNNMLLFGESKLSKSMSNGIKLLNESLKDYEQQIESEFLLVLSNRVQKSNLNLFNDEYGDIAELCIDFHEFVKEAKIDRIGVPVFLAHGSEFECDEIMNMLNKVSSNSLFDMETIYYFISLPIVDKSKFVAVFTRLIRERSEHYEQCR